jgi:hypothetical protein
MTGCPRSILVAVDFGEASARAVAVGGALAAHCGATLRLLHAERFEGPPYFTPEQIEIGVQRGRAAGPCLRMSDAVRS